MPFERPEPSRASRGSSLGGRCAPRFPSAQDLLVDPLGTRENPTQLPGQEFLDLGERTGVREKNRALDLRPSERGEERGRPAGPVGFVSAVLDHEKRGEAALVPGFGDAPAEIRSRTLLLDVGFLVGESDRHGGFLTIPSAPIRRPE